MSNDTQITLVGNLVAEPDLRFTPSGAAVASFTVATTPRTFDKTANEWKDGEAMFLNCSIWRQAAENLAASELTKGTRVVVVGRLKSRSYETREGDKRTVFEIDVDEVGPSLRYATAQVQRTERASSAAQQQPAPAQQQRTQTRKPPATVDPWAHQPATPTFDYDQPPF